MTQDLNRPIVGIDNRTPQEVFDIMCDRFRHRLTAEQAKDAEIVELTALLREARGDIDCYRMELAADGFDDDAEALHERLARIDTILNREMDNATG